MYPLSPKTLPQLRLVRSIVINDIPTGIWVVKIEFPLKFRFTPKIIFRMKCKSQVIIKNGVMFSKQSSKRNCRYWTRFYKNSNCAGSHPYVRKKYLKRFKLNNVRNNEPSSFVMLSKRSFSCDRLHLKPQYLNYNSSMRKSPYNRNQLAVRLWERHTNS